MKPAAPELSERRVADAPGKARALAGLIAGVLGLLLALAWYAPIQQPANYHDFADARTVAGVSHFWNIVSNLPFLVIGVMGLRVLQRPGVPAARLEWMAVFAGTALVAFGSAYYHYAPTDERLVWDRLPIGIAFMGFFAALVAENIDARIGRWMLAPGIVFACAAIYWWRATGDLAPWIWVQAAPMLAIPLVLRLFPSPDRQRRFLLYALACYVAAKILELQDREVMEWTGGLASGHALKHVAAAAGVGCFYAMLVNRASRRFP